MIKAFTLFELLITTAVILIVGTTAILFLNPAGQMAKARNNQRVIHVNIVAGAAKERLIEYRGNFAADCSSGALPGTTTPIGAGPLGYNLEICLVPNYLTVMPLDPLAGTVTTTGYNISYATSTLQITISAPNAELGETVSVTR